MSRNVRRSSGARRRTRSDEAAATRRQSGARRSRETKAAPRSGAWRRTRYDHAPRLRGWLSHHYRLLFESLSEMWRDKLITALLWTGIGLALALLLLLYLALDNLHHVGDAWEEGAGISLYLRLDIDEPRGLELTERIGRLDGVAAVEFRDAEHSLREYREWSGLSDVLLGLESNPLPAVILVRAEDSVLRGGLLEKLRLDLDAYPEVETAMLDMHWVRRLHQFTSVLERVVIFLSLLLVSGTLLAIVYSVRLMIVSRSEEIIVTKLVGGTNAYVCRPFLYSGFWYGLGGGGIALALSLIGMLLVYQPLGELVALYGGSLELRLPGVVEALALLFGAAVLGVFSAWIAVMRYIDQIEAGYEY